MSVNRNQMLYDLGELLVEKKLVEQNPANNFAARLHCDLFTFNAHCWCMDPGRAPDGCDGFSCDDGFSFDHPDYGSYFAGWDENIFSGFNDDFGADIRTYINFVNMISLCRDEINQAGGGK